MLATACVVLMIGCSKSKPGSGSGTGGSTGGKGLSFANTEYVGTCTELSRFWPKPICVHFNDDSTVYAFCVFYLQVHGNNYQYDSVRGKITQIGTGTGGGISVTVAYPDIADTQVYNFSTDMSGLSGGSNGLASNQFYFSGLQKVSDKMPALGASFWNTDTIHSADATNGLLMTPDIAGVQFQSNGFSSYLRNGGAAVSGVVPNQYVIQFEYWQYNSRVYFYGYNEDYPEGVEYFGVLMPDGNTMLCDPYYDLNVARVTSPYSTIDWYGPAESTPTMHKR